MKKGKYLAPREGNPLLAVVKILAAVLAVIIVAFGAWLWFAPEELPEEDASMNSVPATTVPETTQPPQTQPTETQPTEPEVPEEPVERQQARTILAGMTQEEKIYQLFFVVPEQLTNGGSVTQADEDMQTALAERPVGGIILFEENIEDPGQTKTMISGMQSYSKLGLFIGVDEEGGTVRRLGSNQKMGITDVGPMLDIGKNGDTEEARKAGKTIGEELAKLGINVDFAPVADVFSNPENKVIGDRAFSDDPQVAAQMVAAAVEGFQESGVLCTLKHFPGHGDTKEDSHTDTAISNKTLEQMRECEFVPFQAGIQAGAPFVMMGHITVPQVTQEDVPASLSSEVVTGLLREEMGYNGLVISDAMNMGAITEHYATGEATVMALKAGVDIILMPKDLDDAVEGVEDALADGTLTQQELDEKVLRILETKIRAGIIKPL